MNQPRQPNPSVSTPQETQAPTELAGCSSAWCCLRHICLRADPANQPRIDFGGYKCVDFVFGEWWDVENEDIPF
jgi:hypothetical protein